MCSVFRVVLCSIRLLDCNVVHGIVVGAVFVSFVCSDFIYVYSLHLRGRIEPRVWPAIMCYRTPAVIIIIIIIISGRLCKAALSSWKSKKKRGFLGAFPVCFGQIFPVCHAQISRSVTTVKSKISHTLKGPGCAVALAAVDPPPPTRLLLRF